MASPQLDRLQSQLLTSGLQQRDNATWQVISQLINILRASNIEIAVLQENSSSGSSNAITALTTDVVATGPGSVPATIQPLAVTTAKIDNLAVTDAKLAADSVITVKILDANVTNAKLDDTAVTPGTYGDSTHVGQFTVNQKGRITAASSVAIAFPTSGGWEPLMTGIPSWGDASDSELVLDSDGNCIMVPMP